MQGSHGNAAESTDFTLTITSALVLLLQQQRQPSHPRTRNISTLILPHGNLADVLVLTVGECMVAVGVATA